jgi:uncharacterized protein
MARSINKKSISESFRDLDGPTKAILLILLLISLGMIGWVVNLALQRHRVHRFILAAGSRTGESYVLAKAIEQVVEAQIPQVEIEVQETRGTTESLEQLEQRQADLAMMQADATIGPNTRSLAVMFEDKFQLVVQEDAEIKSFVDLKGKRIGLPTKGGQYDSFMSVANHYGLRHKDFTFVGENEFIVDYDFQTKKVDAVFFVRALGNRRVSMLISVFGGRLVPIEQADAMKVNEPAFSAAKIPQGAYRGSSPSVPERDLPTVALKRLLVAHQAVDVDLISQITKVINEQRRDLQNAVPPEFGNAAPLVANIQPPELNNGAAVPLHEGADRYYNRDQPSLIQKNVDLIALSVTLGALFWSWIWEFRNWVARHRKNMADDYIEKLLQTLQACQSGQSSPQECLAQIDRAFEEIAMFFVKEEISQESFTNFMSAYQIVREALDKRV